MINPHDCPYVKEQLTAWSDRTGYKAPVMAFDSRRICLMECFAGKFRLIDDANILKKVISANIMTFWLDKEFKINQNQP